MIGSIMGGMGNAASLNDPDQIRDCKLNKYTSYFPVYGAIYKASSR